MKKQRTQQNGSAHVIIMVVLVVALIGALGYIFYQNFIAKKDSQSSASTQTSSSSNQSSASASTSAPVAKFIAGSIDASFETKLTMQYPDTWKYAQSMSGDVAANSTWLQNITIASPSGKYVVKYTVGAGGGIGGTCNPSENGVLAAVSYENLNTFDGVSYVEQTYANVPAQGGLDDGRKGFVGLMSTATATTVKTGNSVCDTYLKEVIKLADNNYVQLINASIQIADTDSADKLKSALSGTEYEQAKSILLSTSH